MQNSQASPIKITSISISKSGVLCGSVSGLDIDLKQDEITNVILGKMNNTYCQGKVNSCYKFDTSINYINANGYLTHTIEGRVGGSYHPGGILWALGGPWKSRINLDGNITMVNRNGNFLNTCNPQSPPDPITLTDEVPLSTTYWISPNNCNSNLNILSRNGFSAVCGITATSLAQGWLHNTLYIDNVFSSYTFYLGGNAQYIDDSDGQLKTNGICINDNMYIYVNGAFKYQGGTSGKIITATPGNPTPHPFHYQSSDELISHCGGCEDVDSYGWCIPALKLNTAGFNFGQTNNIDILVEDYCGGPPHAGGMSNLNLQIV